MNAVLNHIAVPFFNRVPTRGKPVVLAVFDGIAEKTLPATPVISAVMAGIAKRRR